jgi:hypothetical protein
VTFGRAIVAILASSGAVALASSCFVEGFVRVESGPEPVVDAGGDVTEEDADATVGCGHATWPSPPDGPDPGTDSVDVVFATRQANFGEGETGGAILGYDLDNYCTCQGEGSSCVAPEWATADHCDGPEGRDNAWADIFAAIAVFDPGLTSPAISQQMNAGDFAMLIHVSSYNGMPNDDNVVVALLPSPGLRYDPCLPPDALPTWDGTDQWPVLASSLMGGGGAGAGGAPPADCTTGASVPPGYDVDAPRFVDLQGYVSDSVVVANLPNVEIVLAGSSGGSNIQLTAGFVTGRLEEDGSTGRWTMTEGLLVGRWRVSEVFRSLSSMVTGAGEQVCTDHTVYPLIKSAVCKFPDIASTLGGPTTPCDAISFAMGFEGEQTTIGSVYVPTGAPNPCSPETDPANDSCDPAG